MSDSSKILELEKRMDNIETRVKELENKLKIQENIRYALGSRA